MGVGNRDSDGVGGYGSVIVRVVTVDGSSNGENGDSVVGDFDDGSW